MTSITTFTCITCRVAFADADLQRTHYKTDWHRYNLKRKVVSLPSVTVESFEQRAIQLNAEADEQINPKSYYCKPCGKKLASEGTYTNHIKSSKHQQKSLQHADKKLNSAAPASSTTPKPPQPMAEGSDDEDVEMVSDEEWDSTALPVEQCLFCSIVSHSLEENVKHMQDEHSLFIPDMEYLEDLEGLISYLGEKVGKGKMCLWCKDGGKLYNKTEDVQQHMRDKGHCMIMYEGDLVYEYADFYDYTTSYPEDHPGPSEDVNPTFVLDDSGYQMTLPSGTIIGHRALSRYYKQSLRSQPLPDRSTINRLIGRNKAVGWHGVTGSDAAVRAKDLSYLQRRKQYFQLKMGIKNNKVAQTHLRPQVIF